MKKKVVCTCPTSIWVGSEPNDSTCELPEELHKITDVVLAYRPKPKSKGGKKRVRKAKKAQADAQAR